MYISNKIHIIFKKNYKYLHAQKYLPVLYIVLNSYLTTLTEGVQLFGTPLDHIIISLPSRCHLNLSLVLVTN